MQQQMQIPFFRPSIDNEEYEAVKKVLESGWLTTGSEAILFEQEFADFLGEPSAWALAVNSCTSGLHLAYSVLCSARNTNQKKTCTVVSSPITFVSSVSTALHCGADVQFIDTAKDSLYPDVESIQKVQWNKDLHILCMVPLAGYHEYNGEILDFVSSKDILAVEDVAHAFPARAKSGGSEKKYYGTQADIGVFSFYANKTITCGEGGMVVCKNEEYKNTLTRLRNHGMNNVTWDRYRKNSEQALYDIVDLGYKYNLPDVLACIGRVQLRKAKTLHEKRTKIAMEYIKRLSERDYWILPPFPDYSEGHAWHIFILQIIHPRVDRRFFMEQLHKNEISSSVHYNVLHNMTYFKQRYGLAIEDFPNAYEVSSRVLSIPLYADMTIEHVAQVCDTLIKIGDLH